MAAGCDTDASETFRLPLPLAANYIEDTRCSQPTTKEPA